MITPLYDIHCSMGARIVDFAGYLMPVLYTSIIEEHKFVRSSCGIFDVSHMAEIFVDGKDSAAFLESIAANRVGSLKEGKIVYSPVCDREGGCVDDILIYNFGENRYMVVANASNRENVFNWLTGNRGDRQVSILDVSDDTAMIAVQGPASAEVLEKAGMENHGHLGYYEFSKADWDSKKMLVSRTGYTGEDGFEVFGTADEIIRIWQKLLEQKNKVRPVGLGARDTLRLECCYSLYGHELSRDITPLEADLGWAIDKNKDFIGKDALLKRGQERIVAGFEMMDSAVPRSGCEVYGPVGEKAGFVTSGSFLPTLGKGMGLCLIRKDCARVGAEIYVNIRNNKKKAQIVKKPFYVPVQRRRKG